MKINQCLAICGIGASLFLVAEKVSAQTNIVNLGGNNGLAQQHFLARIHYVLGFTNETEWNAVRPLVQKVFEAQREFIRGAARSRAFRDNGNGTNAIVQVSAHSAFFSSQPNQEAQALEQAIDDNASDAQIEAVLAQYQTAQRARKANLLKAQEDLRKALNPRQEAQATLLKLLD